MHLIFGQAGHPSALLTSVDLQVLPLLLLGAGQFNIGQHLLSGHPGQLFPISGDTFVHAVPDAHFRIEHDVGPLKHIGTGHGLSTGGNNGLAMQFTVGHVWQPFSVYSGVMEQSSPLDLHFRHGDNGHFNNSLVGQHLVVGQPKHPLIRGAACTQVVPVSHLIAAHVGPIIHLKSGHCSGTVTGAIGGGTIPLVIAEAAAANKANNILERITQVQCHGLDGPFIHDVCH